ncbi:MAG TPA: Clp protease N-terminal domain-containing protein [Chloroflexia bacterium]|jgi:ATP-dependent Clp protease ATP-binding subunit ClpA
MPRNPFRREPHDRFDKFTERALNVLHLAQAQAQHLNHSSIGTEHLLLGILSLPDGAAARVLNKAGVELADVLAKIVGLVGTGEAAPTGEMGLAPEAKRAIGNAVETAFGLGHHYIGTEHLLLGVLRVEGLALQVLSELGFSLEELAVRAYDAVQASSGDLDLGQPQGPRFDKFTERARKVLQLSQEEAERFNHHYIGTEHILLGLVREGDGVAAQVLRNLGIELHRVRSAVEFIIGRGDRMVMREIGLTPRAKRVIELAVDEARRLNHHYIGTEHLLLGVVREGEGVAAGVLESLGVSLEKVRAQVIEVLRVSSGYSSAPADVSRAETARTASQHPPHSVGVAFDRQARAVLRIAQEEARRLSHNYVGVEHVFLALLGLNSTRSILNRLGLELVQTRDALESIAGKGEQEVTGEIEFTPQTRQAVRLTADLSRKLGRVEIGSELLLLGILRLGESAVTALLSRFGVHPDTLRAEVLESLLVQPDASRLAAGGEAGESQIHIYYGDSDDVLTWDVDQPGGSAKADADLSHFSRFSRGAWDVLRLATAESQRLQHGYVGTEHLLLALLLDEEGVLPHVLKQMDLAPDRVLAVVAAVAGKGETQEATGITLTSSATRALRLAVNEATRLGHETVGSEHILLGLLREGDDKVAAVLGSLDVSVAMVRARVLDMIGSGE